MKCDCAMLIDGGGRCTKYIYKRCCGAEVALYNRVCTIVTIRVGGVLCYGKVTVTKKASDEQIL